MKFKNDRGQTFDTSKSDYTCESLVADVARLFTNRNYRVQTVTVTESGYGNRTFTRVPDTYTVYEFRVLLSGTCKPLTEWIETTRADYAILGCADNLETRTREVPA